MLSLLSIQKIRVAITVVIFCILNFVIYTPTTQASFVGGTSIMSTTSLNTGLVGYWTFDGKDMVNGVALDKSGRNNNANLINISSSTFYALGKIGQGLKFDGTNDYVKTTTWTNIAGAPITTSGWIKMASTTNTGADYFYSERGNCTASGNFGFGFYVGPSGKPGFVSYGVLQYDSVTSPRVDDNKWHYVVAVYDLGFDVTFYVDGVKYDKILHSANMTGKATCAALIGAVRLTAGYPNNIAYFTKATFDDIRIYNRAISVDEIKTLYSASPYVVANAPTAGKYTTGLVGHWTFDGQDMSGVRALDASGQGNNGTLTGGPTRMAGKLGQGLQFDGSDDHINILSDFSEPSRLAVSLWFKTTDTDAALFGQHDAINPNTTPTAFVPTLGITTGGFLRGEFWTGATGGVTTSTQVNDGQWHHAVMVGDATSQFLYVDGVYIGSRSGTIAQSWWVRSVIGTGYDDAVSSRLGSGVASWKYFSGQIDEVRLYNRALSLNEVRLLYNLGR